MQKKSYYIINAITAYRLLAAPVLFILILEKQVDLFKWLLAISFLTDAIDGFLARYYKVASAFGAKLDSIADDLTVLVGLVGLVIYKPDFVRSVLYLLILLFVIFILQNILAYRRYGKATSFHTYLAKIAAVFQGSFLILSFFTADPLYPLFYAAIGITLVELIEEIILVLVLSKWEINVKGLYWVLKRNKSKA
ncbi:MAG TPA: CDP-alcohol phosphatidyltransferase family protein [Chitinophagaceae bacterium]|nr:CDP-alcohol phosphatidyltransferase family protein [Chitinophagaceae bacterium]